MNRKALIITYYWPPSGGAGVQRWLKFAKYLRLSGWEPIIYTPLNPEYPAFDETLEREIPNGIQVIKTPIWEPYSAYKKLTLTNKSQRVNASGFIIEKKKPGLLQRLSIWLRGNFFIPDARKFWIQPSVKFLTNWLQENQVDAIISTGPPHSMHMIALGLKQITGIPWLADFRDPWTNIDFYQDLNLTKWADKKHHSMELQVLEKADEVIVISDSMKSDFLKIKDRNYTVITNGFDRADTDHVIKSKDSSFSLAHIGSMAKTRNPELLWKALSILSEQNADFKQDLIIKLVGSVDFSIIQMLEKYNLINNLLKVDYLPHDTIIEIQKQSRVLLLLVNDTPNAKVILPGKFFEYMASGRPILCIGPKDGDVAKIMNQTGSGFVVEKDNLAEIIETIFNLYTNYKQDNDDVTTSGIAMFSRENLTIEMAKRLDAIVKYN